MTVGNHTTSGKQTGLYPATYTLIPKMCFHLYFICCLIIICQQALDLKHYKCTILPVLLVLEELLRFSQYLVSFS